MAVVELAVGKVTIKLGPATLSLPKSSTATAAFVVLL
jgi:hypothetical protein